MKVTILILGARMGPQTLKWMRNSHALDDWRPDGRRSDLLQMQDLSSEVCLP